MKGWRALLLVMVFGMTHLSWATDGFRAFTSEGARRLDITRTPRPLPDVAMTDMNGETMHLADWRGRLVLVEFMYTTCPTICYVMGSSLEQVDRLLAERGMTDDVAILSISFDPDRDSLEMLRYYGERFGADGKHWAIATVPDKAALADILDIFGVTVIPVGDGTFEHNGALQLVGRDGRLVDILDYNAPHAILDKLEARR